MRLSLWPRAHRRRDEQPIDDVEERAAALVRELESRTDALQDALDLTRSFMPPQINTVRPTRGNHDGR